jgi:predicted secreted protein
MRWTWTVALVICGVMAAPCATLADSGTDHDRVEFTVRAETAVANNLAEVVLAAQAEHHDPTKVAEEINAAMAWALDQVHGITAVTADNGAYQTYPVYDKTRLDHWRGIQTLVLRSKRIAALNALVGTLQQRLQVRNMRFTVSPEQRQASEAHLVDQVLDRFKARALRIQQRLGATGYDIVNLKLGGSATPPFLPLEHMTMARAAGSAPVAAEAGTSRQTLSIDAIIQLRF